jgi:hypothetical protein
MFDAKVFAQFTKSQLRALGFMEVGSSAYDANAEDEDWQLRLTATQFAEYKAAGEGVLEEVRPGVLRLETVSDYGMPREIFFYIAGEVISETAEENQNIILSWDAATQQDWIQERSQMVNGNGNGTNLGRKAEKALLACKFGLNPLTYLNNMSFEDADRLDVADLWLQTML